MLPFMYPSSIGPVAQCMSPWRFHSVLCLVELVLPFTYFGEVLTGKHRLFICPQKQAFLALFTIRWSFSASIHFLHMKRPGDIEHRVKALPVKLTKLLLDFRVSSCRSISACVKAF